MNNALSPLKRYLSDLGYNVDLFVLPQEPDHFKPGADSFEPVDYTLLDWHYENFLTYSKQKLQQLLAPYSFIICQGIAPAYIHKAGRKADLFIPYGGDMYRLPHFKKIRVKGNIKKNIKRFFIARAQKNGIRKAHHILMEESNPFFEDYLNALHPQGERIKLASPQIYIEQYTNYISKYAAKSVYFDAFSQISNKHAFIVFQHARQMWKDIPDHSYSKGNDLLIKAFARLVKQHAGAALILFEYGNDVNNSKELIASLGITDAVYWMPLMPRKEIMMGMGIADVVVGELTHSYFSYGVVHETLAAGKVLMHKRTDELYKDYYTELYPMLHADSEETAYEKLEWAFQHRNELNEMGIRGKNWIRKNVVESVIPKITALFTA
ncbi:MAG: glycosyltransferase [Bacteroidota bacterium]